MSARKRSIISLLSLALALALLLAAAPLQAQTPLPPLTGFQFDGTESTNSKNRKWKFSWDSIVNGNEVKAEVNAGSLGSSEGLWLAVGLSVSRSNFRTRVSFIAPDSQGLQVRFKVFNTAGQSTTWRYATVSS